MRKSKGPIRGVTCREDEDMVVEGLRAVGCQNVRVEARPYELRAGPELIIVSFDYDGTDEELAARLRAVQM